MQFTVAIDGPAAAGKGTISRAVAQTFGFAHLDTGLLYRAIGAKAMHLGRGVIVPEQAVKIAQELSESDLERDDLRTPRVARAASKVAVIPAVREALVQFQRDFARRTGGAVIDGRDIGTVICPDAEVKLFVTASDEVRAKRRYAELVEAGTQTTPEAVLADIRARDARDRERDTAPMVAAEDAHLLDTTELSIERAVADAVAVIRKRIEQGQA